MLMRLVAIGLFVIVVAFFLELVLGIKLGLVRLVQHDAAAIAGSLSPW